MKAFLNHHSMRSLILISVCLLLRCASNDLDLIETKNQCYREKLRILKSDSAYHDVMLQFTDTFKVLRLDTRYFGVPSRVENKIDDAVFFNKDKTKCILIVLQKTNLNFAFGAVRVIEGRLHGPKWIFELSIDMPIDSNFFNVYKENSFENISIIGRYSVLIRGNVRDKGCEIDENFWFEELFK